MTVSVAPQEDRRTLGIGLLAFAQVFFAVLDTSAKWLTVANIPVFEVVFVRYAVPVILLTAILLPSRGWNLFRTANLKLELLRGLCLAGVTVALFFSMKFLPLTVTGALLFTMPLMVCALSVPLLGETVGWRRWAAIAVGFMGILIIVRPGTEAFHPASLLCLVGALCAAFYSILTRKLAGVDPASTQTIYAAAISVACVAPFAFDGWVWPTDPPTWTALLLVGVAGLFAHQLLTVAHRFAPPSTLAPFSYLELIYLAIASWIVFAEPPDAWFYAGAPLIIASGLYIWLRERALHRETSLAAVED